MNMMKIIWVKGWRYARFLLYWFTHLVLCLLGIAIMMLATVKKLLADHVEVLNDGATSGATEGVSEGEDGIGS